jgi:hypothetical protein
MRVTTTALALLALAIAGGSGCGTPSSADVVEVYKSPTCGCCEKWVDHLEANGFEVHTTDLPDVAPVKAEKGVPRELASCHTALIEGYVVEGHVPAADIKRLLEERPDIDGIAVPGMPIGSPGMEGLRPESYDVVSFDDGAKVGVFATHQGISSLP